MDPPLDTAACSGRVLGVKYGEICSAYTLISHRGGNLSWESLGMRRRLSSDQCLGFLSRSKTHDPLSKQKIVQRISVSIQQFNSLCIGREHITQIKE